MSDRKERNLLNEFPPVSTEQWEEVITADLKGADYDKKLVWKTAEGFNVRPYYRAEDLKGLSHLDTAPGQFPYVRSTGCTNDWRITQTVTVDDPAGANAEALSILNSGVNSIVFDLKKELTPSGLDKLLDGIHVPAIEITFRGKNIEDVAHLVIAKATTLACDPKEVRINFVIDPIINRLSLRGAFGCCEDGTVCFENIKKMASCADKYKRMKFVTVSGETFQNSGSTIVQELAFTLAAGHEYLVRLMEAGLDVNTAARTIRFSMSVSANYFMEIAKFRAARMLWANIVKQYDPTCGCAEKMHIHAVTSKWNMTVYDPYVNMLRGTTEAMSATIAAVQSLEVLPFDAAFERPTEFSSRIARNVQLLLKHESHFDSVVDPAGGSYYIETLTANIADNAWNLFREVEGKGGYIAAFKEGFIQDKVAASVANKDKNIATRREILLGTNQYPNFNEVAEGAVTETTVTRGACACGCEDCKCDDGKCDCDGTCDCGCGQCTCPDPNGVTPLVPYRGGMPFEELRLKVDRSGKEPKAFMLTAGTLGMARARSQFSSNFFGCAGIRVIDNTFFSDAEEGARKAVESGAEIVVLCAADDDYATLAPKVKQLIGDRILVIAGAPACEAELREQGITNFINVRSNVLETLKSYVAQLGI